MDNPELYRYIPKDKTRLPGISEIVNDYQGLPKITADYQILLGITSDYQESTGRLPGNITREY